MQDYLCESTYKDARRNPPCLLPRCNDIDCNQFSLMLSLLYIFPVNKHT